MTFGELKIGAKFFHAYGYGDGAVFLKKSKSSAYTLNPVTFEPEKLHNFARNICDFSAGVVVHEFKES